MTITYRDLLITAAALVRGGHFQGGTGYDLLASSLDVASEEYRRAGVVGMHGVAGVAMRMRAMAAIRVVLLKSPEPANLAQRLAGVPADAVANLLDQASAPLVGFQLEGFKTKAG